MTAIKIKIPIIMDRKSDPSIIKNLYGGLALEWNFVESPIILSSNVVIKKKQRHFYDRDLALLQKLMAIFPQDEKYKEEYLHCQKKKKEDWEYAISLTFQCEIPAEIDEESNAIFFNIRPDESDDESNSFETKWENHYALDEFYEEDLKRFILCVTMSSILANPKIDLGSAHVTVYFDSKKYKNEFYLENPFYDEIFEKHHDIITEEISFYQAFLWIKTHTSIFQQNIKSPLSFSALTYIFNRESPEKLLYSIMGLESLYVPNNKGVSFILQKHINRVFPSITKQQIKDMYDKRSKFVHGEIRIGNYHLIDEVVDDMYEFQEIADFATALLLESVRKLIAYNAEEIKFEEHIDYTFI